MSPRCSRASPANSGWSGTRAAASGCWGMCRAAYAGRPRTGGNIYDGGYYDYDSGHWATPIDIGGAPSYRDADAFNVGSGSISNETDWAAANLARTRSEFEVRKAGSLIFYQTMRWRINGSGNIPAGTRTVLGLVRNGVLVEHSLASYGLISGDGIPQEFVWLWLGDVEAGDWLYPIVVYPKTATVSLLASPTDQLYRAVLLDQTVIHRMGKLRP